MATVTGITTQTGSDKTYYSWARNAPLGEHPCDLINNPGHTVSCKEGDFPLSVYPCHGLAVSNQYVCGTINNNTCPSIDGSITGVEIKSADANGKATIGCNYSSNRLDSYDKIRQFRSTFPNTQSRDALDDSDVFPNFCSQQATNCIEDPINGNRTACSMMMDKGEWGNACREWAGRMVDSGKASTVTTTMQRYCNAHDTSDCDCINRTARKGYQDATKSGAFKSAPDTCWWVPCKDTTHFLVPPTIPRGECPNVCSIATNILASEKSTIDVGQFAQSVACNFASISNSTPSKPTQPTPAQPTPSKPTPTQPSSTQPSSTQPTQQSFLSKYGIWIVVAIVIIVIIAIVLVLIL